MVTLAAGTPIGKYVVRRKLAEGGMAEIYLASVRGPEGFEKEVVIKRVRAFLSKDPGFVRMFVAEARLASRLNHANLVQIFDFDEHDNTYYLAMEYVRGQSLAGIRKRAQEQMTPMPSVLAAHVCAEVAKGLHYAHKLSDKGKPVNLVHRDVTPHNVLISYDGAVKLTDFGIAKAGAKLTAPGMLKGKFAYMSPEQARGEDVDARTDVFALGIVLWELLTGGRLFEGDSDIAVLRAVQQSQIAPPARLNPDVPLPLSDVVLRALSRDRTQRYQSAQELERALAQFVLTHARVVDDTDVGLYVRRLFPEEASASITEATGGPADDPSKTDPSPSGVSEPTAAQARAGSESSLSRTQPSPAPPLSPDEDGSGSTHVVRRGTRSSQPSESDDDERAQRPTVGIRRGSGGPTPSVDPVAGPSWSRPTVGMRRGVLAGAALLFLLASAALAISALSRAPAAVHPSHADTGKGTEGEPLPSTVESFADADVSPREVTAAKLGPIPGVVDAGKPPLKEESRARRVRPGILVVRATPWAELFVDGRALGEVAEAHRRLSLPAGNHRVLFKHPLRSKSFEVVVEPGRETVREFHLSK
ncbi:MAG: serine/threonine protein kinase [Myxococcota bacterium]